MMFYYICSLPDEIRDVGKGNFDDFLSTSIPLGCKSTLCCNQVVPKEFFGQCSLLDFTPHCNIQTLQPPEDKLEVCDTLLMVICYREITLILAHGIAKLAFIAKA